MQTISGIHYNFSLPDHLWQALGITTQQQRTEAYFGLIRNFRRWSWLLIYLFGASPAVCRSFTRNLQHNLQPFDEGSLHLPYGTSLRMGPLGYQSSAQSALHISYNTLDEYANSMVDALTRTYPAYAHMGVKKDGEYQQLNTNVLQIENEFYGTIRPKRRTHKGERPVHALRERGVEYVEVRCLDLNPFLPVGIDETQIRFLDTFLLLCLLADSAPDSVAESRRLTDNQLTIVQRGRDPAALLTDDAGQQVSPAHWGHALLDQCQALAQLLDQVPMALPTIPMPWPPSGPNWRTLNRHLLPRCWHACALEEIPFFRFTMNQAIKHQAHFRADPLSAEDLARFKAYTADSVAAPAGNRGRRYRTFRSVSERVSGYSCATCPDTRLNGYEFPGPLRPGR